MIGLIPAAGKATRMQGLPKYLLPIPGNFLLRLVTERIGSRCYIGANTENYELVRSYLRTGDTAYLINSKSMPQTILAGKRYAGDSNVVCAMPDTFWTDDFVISSLENCLTAGAICAVALFAVSDAQSKRLGMCHTVLGTFGLTLVKVEDKPERSASRRAWGVLAWSPEFWQYIREDDAHMGIALQRAIDAGVEIAAVHADGRYYDCGTPDEYFTLIRELTEVHHAAI